MNEQAVAALAEILECSPAEARAVIRRLRERGFRVWRERPVDRLAEYARGADPDQFRDHS